MDLVLCNSPVFWLIGCCQCFHLNVMRNYNICYVLLCLFNDFRAERSIFIISLGMASAVLPQKTDLHIDVVVMLICNEILSRLHCIYFWKKLDVIIYLTDPNRWFDHVSVCHIYWKATASVCNY